MSLIIERLKEKQAMENREPDDFTAQNLLDKLYELIDSGKIHKDARVIINNDMRCLFMCTNCNVMNEKHYKNTVLKFEIHEGNSDFTTLEVFTIKRKGR